MTQRKRNRRKGVEPSGLPPLRKVVTALATLFSVIPDNDMQRLAQYAQAARVLHSYESEVADDDKMTFLISLMLCASDLCGALAAALADERGVEPSMVMQAIARHSD